MSFLHKKIEPGKMLRSNRVVFLLSLLLAIAVWIGVTISSGNIQTRIIKVPTTVSLNNTYASQIGLKLISETSTEVSVEVRGKWSIISKLTEADLEIRADVSSIQKAGEQKVQLIPSRSSSIVDYDILSCTPSMLTIDCDYWSTASVDLQIETPSLKAEGQEGVQLGTPVTESKLTDNKVTVSGPQSVVEKIDHLVAKITNAESLKETKTFTSELQAVDVDGKALSLKNCSFAEFDSSTIKIVVPVEISKEMSLGATWMHAPSYFEENPLELEIDPETVKVMGALDAMKALGEVFPIRVIDFDNLSNEYYHWRVHVQSEGSLRVDEEVSIADVSLDLTDYSRKTFSVPVSDKNVTVTRNGKNMKTAIQEKTETITLIGKSSDLNKITTNDIKFSVDLGNSDAPGTSAYSGRVVIEKDQSVWAYYGATGTGISVYVTLS
ncbi:MAG: hypothetical protein J6Z00_00040 [Clostridia bacterium]|nr:hypothetical protein [Clostridia bacterium]